jgi:hypothetical protein
VGAELAGMILMEPQHMGWDGCTVKIDVVKLCGSVRRWMMSY